MINNITIAIASGKGGTGKTMLSVALAQLCNEEVMLIDCDVEEPNIHVFLDLEDEAYEDVLVQIPEIDESKCTLCGKCSEICEFNAIAVLKNEAMIFNDLCHSCGGCMLICENNAIFEKPKAIGKIKKARDKNIIFVEGRIDVGNALVPPVIREAKKRIDTSKLNILDCPPGTACPAVTSMNGADYIILVTEATPFGLHDLKLSVDVVRNLDIPFGVIINKSDVGDSGVKDYCINEKIELMLEIPEDIRIARAYSRGEIIASCAPEIEKQLENVLDVIKRGVE